MKRIKNILFSCSLFLIFLSCHPENITLTDEQLGYHYFPIEIGKTWIYKTDSILYQKSNGVFGDTIHTFIRETVADTFIDADGNRVFSVEIFNRKQDTLPWDLIGNTFITYSKFNVIRNDFGFDFIKLVFPISVNKSWNGNIRIDQSTEIKLNGEFFKPFSIWSGKTYYYMSIQNNQMVGNSVYQKVLDVEEIDFEDDINKYLSIVRYAEDVGIVYREFQCLSTSDPDIFKPWGQKAEYGAIIKQTLIK